jgi:hypothetical protein
MAERGQLAIGTSNQVSSQICSNGRRFVWIGLLLQPTKQADLGDTEQRQVGGFRG